MIHNNIYNQLLNQVNEDVYNIKTDEHCQVISGVLSDSLFLLISGNRLGNQKLINRSYELIDYHLETAEKFILNYKWAHGITGLGWMIATLCNEHLLDLSILGEIEQLDEHIGRSLLYDFEFKSYDFSVGALGKVHYFLERKNTTTNSFLSQTIDYLDYSAVQYKEIGCFWLDNYTIEKPDDLLINFGLFHGHTSIIYFLSKIYNAGISVQKCEKLLNSSMNFLEYIYRTYDQNIPNGILFDRESGILNQYSNEAEIQGWCHGLLSNSLAFYIGAKTLKNQKWLDIFYELLDKVCSYELDRIEYLSTGEPTFYLKNGKGRIDSTFCHGLIGHIYMLDKLNKIDPNEKLKKSSQYWEDILMKYCLKDSKLPNYFYHKGMIMGKSGLGLFLLQKLNMDTSILDKLFLLDLESFS